VFVACNFLSRPIFVLAGAEGSGHDQPVLNLARRSHGLHIPKDSFYLADSAYTLTTRVLTPYRGYRYHIAEWDTRLPVDKFEHFNWRHAQLRAVVECLFGMIKAKFKILRWISFSSIPVQVKIIQAAFLLFSFIQANEEPQDDGEASEEDSDDDSDEPPPNDDAADERDEPDHSDAVEWRDALAQTMWDDYQQRQCIKREALHEDDSPESASQDAMKDIV